jgi:chemotaxis signal transduction protein
VLLRQGDLEVGLPVAQVEDIVEAPVDLPVRRLPGRAVAGLPGVVQLGGQAASWLDVPAFMEALS